MFRYLSIVRETRFHVDSKNDDHRKVGYFHNLHSSSATHPLLWSFVLSITVKSRRRNIAQARSIKLWKVFDCSNYCSNNSHETMFFSRIASTECQNNLNYKLAYSHLHLVAWVVAVETSFEFCKIFALSSAEVIVTYPNGHFTNGGGGTGTSGPGCQYRSTTR